MTEIINYFLLFIIYGFLGWCLEVICKLISKRKFINRGFLIGPICPIYGFGAVIMQIFLAKYLSDPVTLFIMIVLTCSLLEYTTSYLLEKIFATRWWDYSTYRFNINGRICLETMIPFGIFGMILMYYINPFFLHLFSKIPDLPRLIIAVILFCILIVDTITSFNIIHNIQKISQKYEKKQIIKRDDTEKITALVKKEIEKSKKKFQQRVIHAFPKLKMIKRKKK